MRKKILTILFAGLAAMQLMACGAVKFEVKGPTSRTGASITKDGSTTGSSNTKTLDRGSASFNIDDSKAEFTNVSFDIPSGYKVSVETVDDGLIYNKGVVTDNNGEFAATIVEGNYTEDITVVNYNEALNDILKPFQVTEKLDFDTFGDAAKVSTIENGVLYSCIQFNNGVTIFIRTEGSNYYMVAVQDLDSTYNLIGKIGFDRYLKYSADNAQAEAGREAESRSSEADESERVYETAQSENESYREVDDIRETNGNPDEYKEGLASKVEFKDSEDVLKETQSAAKTSGDIDKYLITIDNKPYSVNIDSSLVSDSTDHIIFMDNGLESVSATITDSYVDIGDTEELQLELKSLEDVSGKKGQLGNVTFENGQEDAYVIVLEDDGWNKLEVYQPIPGYNHYIKVEITDFSKSYDIDTLINTYGVNTTT